MTGLKVPTATYRLQFSQNFTFNDASNIIAYLHKLGISHIYASPYLKARTGSPHGYDIVDHNELNPEIGSEDDFSSYVDILHSHGMGQILDIVPNHMGVGGDDNKWWLDVLENGEASTYADFFDIDWHPVNPALHNKVLLPFLDDHYGKVLEQGKLKLHYEPDETGFSIRYYEHRFPIDPRSYPIILEFRVEELQLQLDDNTTAFSDYISLIADCKSLPRRTDLSKRHRQQRHIGTTRCKRALAGICREQPRILQFIQNNIILINGNPPDPKSYNLLHHLLEAQAFRLAYWQVASDEINYRRFFDINDLAGIRMENIEVFNATHQRIRLMISKGQVNGLRIDHPDGLSDPNSYYCNLQELARSAQASVEQTDVNNQDFYVLVEKILASHESLRSEWPVSGTTGYDVANLLNGIMVYPASERDLSRQYFHFIGRDMKFDELLYERKRLIIHNALSSELTMLTNLVSGIARMDRQTRDFTYYSLRYAIGEVVACFPVYRTYITAESVSDDDRRYIAWAIAQAKKHNPATDTLIFMFINELLMLNRIDCYTSTMKRKVVKFVLRFQQYTAPVHAKAEEDTAFYIYNRLISLNDVGFEPHVYGITLNAFHYENRRRQEDWPHTMVTTSTHDSKRSEDARARINVLSEVADEWHRHLKRWARINRNQKRRINGGYAPSRNDEYFLYQTLIGVWPLEEEHLINSGQNTFCDRILAYMLKAVKEAKVHTSWINPNEEYEEATRHFVNRLLRSGDTNAFLGDFLPFQKRIAHFGMLNSLSQTLLKFTIPGVPDIYQGNELWTFDLVDPDNRRPVDFKSRNTALDRLITKYESSDNLTDFCMTLLEEMNNGNAKLYLTWQILNLRHKFPKLFKCGVYTSLTASGPKADHLCVFSRRIDGFTIIVIATRWHAQMSDADTSLPIGSSTWKDTIIEVDERDKLKTFRNLLTNEYIQPLLPENTGIFHADDILKNFPVALLMCE